MKRGSINVSPDESSRERVGMRLSKTSFTSIDVYCFGFSVARTAKTKAECEELVQEVYDGDKTAQQGGAGRTGSGSSASPK